jgi:hypothetical protein
MSSSNTAKNIRVDRAFSFGLIPLLAMDSTVIDRFVTPLPVVKKLITKSSRDRVRASKNPVITPGIISGIITLLKA